MTMLYYKFFLIDLLRALRRLWNWLWQDHDDHDDDDPDGTLGLVERAW